MVVSLIVGTLLDGYDVGQRAKRNSQVARTIGRRGFTDVSAGLAYASLSKLLTGSTGASDVCEQSIVSDTRR